MAEELAYVLINPYTIVKSRTGGVIARLLGRASAELVAARMFAPSKGLVEEYIASMAESTSSEHPEVRALIQNYVRENYSPDSKTGECRRVMFLLFKGEGAIKRLHDEVVGHITHETVAGETIRDTYGDYVKGPEGKIRYFEPAVMMVPDAKVARKQLEIWLKHADKDSGLLRDVVRYKSGVKPQNTLVLIKPDCFQWPSSRAGNIIDMFSKTGLYIVAAKVLQMSVAQAEEFYGPVKAVLLDNLKEQMVGKTKKALSSAFDFSVPQNLTNEVGEKLNALNAEYQFNKIVQFMTGADRIKEPQSPGRVKCLALVYQGEEAIKKIRSVLGVTDPSKAAPSTVRKEFGQDVLVNTAHASDSQENAEREMRIINIEENDLKKVIEKFYEKNN